MSTDVFEINELRGKPRVETKVKIRVGEIDEVFTGNLSKSGFFLETSHPFATVGEKLQIEMVLTGRSDPIRAVCKVARVTGPHRIGTPAGMALEFLRIEVRQARTFERLVDRLLEARGIGSRKHPRVKSQLVVEIKSKADARRAITENLSKGGIFFRTSTEGVALGDLLHVVLLHPTSRRKFESDAHVVHLRKGDSTKREDFTEGVGVEFSASAVRRYELSSFLRSILAMKKRPRRSQS